ncbi:MAG: hypothetical protein OXC92_06240 [Flavobacteriaceae bacterium]|nr:hypothetical protein [Flavobacteriaceae bacterium]MCY4254316.1 hypothetical protein [Flavobacteriaceae bacterium]
MSDKSRYGGRNNNQIIPKEIHLGAERLAKGLKTPNFAEKEQRRSLTIEPER